MLNVNNESKLKKAVGVIKRAFLSVAFFSFFINTLMLTAPFYMMQLFDRVLTSRSTDTLIMLFGVACAALITLGLLEIVRSFILIRVSNWFDSYLSGDVIKASVSAALTRSSPPSIQGLRDINTCKGFLSGPSIFPLLDAPWSPIFLLVLFAMHPLLGWISLAGALVLFLIALGNEFLTRRPLEEANAAMMQALSNAETGVRNADVVEAMGMRQALTQQWYRQNTQVLGLQTKASVLSSFLSSTSKVLRLILQIVILSAGAWLVLGNELAPGAMIAGSILMGRALAPVEQAIGAWKSMIAARESYGRLKGQLLGVPIEDNAMPLPEPSGKLTVEQVLFGHKNTKAPTINNVNFALQPGEVLGIIGPTAAGKSTLARLLVGNLKPLSGHVRLDGMDIAEWVSDDRGQYLGYLPQDVELFNGTVRENIARLTDADTDQIVEAARRAHVHEMILRLPQSYETIIGDSGLALSGGQRQRIGLARALFGNPKLVVLDEPNASLDQDGEEALLRSVLTAKKHGVTIILISHRPTSIRCADKLLVLNQGRMEKYGPKDEVLKELSLLSKSNTKKARSQDNQAQADKPKGQA